MKQSLNFVYVRTVDICSSYLDIVLSNGVKPFVVFDGLLLPAKEMEHNDRKRYYSKCSIK